MSAVVLQNLAVAAILAVAALAVRAMAASEQYREAWSRIRKGRIAMVSLAVLCLYVAVGVLDSVCWRDAVRDEQGKVVTDDAGAPVLDSSALSVIDRLLTPLRENREKTYSAPFARVQYTKETVVLPGGGKARANPELRHPRAHLLGTDRVGNDVLFLALKGCRTALVIGGLTTLLVIPLAVMFGLAAGYFGGRVDDVIQYIYTTLESIPSILLISAYMLITGRSLFNLCVIMGVTSWTGLCRLLRGEALKLREQDYVRAAKASGLGSARIIARHLLPNVMHVVLIVFILRFSGLVLSEAVLTYLGIGVDAGTGSWGRMVDISRAELTREPLVWWNLAAAFGFMFGLVLPLNLFGDAVRDALDPKLRT